jgi:heat-inducible transcriptional repressor
MELTQRQRIIFKTIVEEFTRCAEPVGSKTLMQILDFPVSSATIRNEMAVLEKAGLIEKTHTSSGRVPSQKGYRYYVEHLMVTNLDENTKNSLQQVFSQRHYSLDEVVEKSYSILSQMTNLTSIVLGPDSRKQKLQHIQLIPINSTSAVAIFVTDQGHTENKVFRFRQNVSVEDIKNCTDLLNDHLTGTPINEVVDRLRELEPLMAAKLVRHEILFEAFVTAFMRFATEKVAVSGRGNMLAYPEFSDVNRLKELMNILESGPLFQQWTNQAGNISVHISSRNELLQIGDCSVITTKFHYNNDEEGQLMIVGPNRMQYSKVVALMDYMSNVIEEVFSVEGGGDDESKRNE